MNVNFEAIEKAWFKPKKTVLDELEKYLENEIKEYKKDGYDISEIRHEHLWLAGCYDEDKYILYYIQELKNEVK